MKWTIIIISFAHINEGLKRPKFFSRNDTNTESAVINELLLYNFITRHFQYSRWQNDASKCDVHLPIKYYLMESLTFSWSYCLSLTLNEASHCHQNEKMFQVGHSFLHIPGNCGHAGFVFSNFSALYNYDGLWEFL